MKILLLGPGGREHALAWTIAGSPLVEQLWCAPATPASRGKRNACRWPRATTRRSWSCAGRSRSTSSWSGPRRRSSPASSTTSRRRASAHSGRARRRRGSKARRPSPRSCARERHPDRRLRALHRCRVGQGLYRASRARRSSSRPTGSRPARASWSRRRSPKRKAGSKCVRRRVRRSRHEVVIEEFLEGEEVSLSHCATARPRSRRLAQDHKRAFDGDRAEHRRHGHLFAGAVFRRRARERDDRASHSPDAARHEGDGRALQRRSLSRADADRARARS